MDRKEIYELIDWWKNLDSQGMDITKYFLLPLMKAFGNDVEEILSFLDELPVSDLELVSGCFEHIYAKFMTEDVYSALGLLENKLNK